MTESTFEYKQNRAAEGANCADRSDLLEYMHRISADAHSLRHGLSEAVIQVCGGGVRPDGSAEALPYPADRVERLLFDDLMGAGVLVPDQNLAAALRQAMRLLEDAAHAAYWVRATLRQADDTVAACPNETLRTPA